MIDSNIGRAAFRIGFYIAFVSGLLSFFTEPNTPERAISLLTLIISILFLLLVVILVRTSSRGARKRRE